MDPQHWCAGTVVFCFCSSMTTFPVFSAEPFSVQGFYKTGLRTDVVQHALLLPVLVNHVRLHLSLNFLGKFSPVSVRLCFTLRVKN